MAAAILYALLAINALLGRADVAGVSSAPPFLLVGLPTILIHSLLAAYVFRRSAFPAVISLRFGFYYVWHILWAL